MNCKHNRPKEVILVVGRKKLKEGRFRQTTPLLLEDRVDNGLGKL